MEEKIDRKKAWCVVKNMEKKPGVSFSIHIKINDEVELKHYFFQTYDLNLSFLSKGMRNTYFGLQRKEI